MSVLDYCCKIQDRVTVSKPDQNDPLFMEWFGDTGRASKAVTHALEGRNGKALAIAEPLAERYGLR
jgi:hypothetical protein